MDTIIDYGVKIVFALLGILITTYVIPWLKEKKLYDVVYKIVKAAEKYAENNPINKKEYVVGVLEGRGIKVSPYVDAIIEACVLELDNAFGKTKEEGE